MPYNLTSPAEIVERCDLSDLTGWFKRELRHGIAAAERKILLAVVDQLDAFVGWPTKAILLWRGCTRVPDEGQRQKYHRYPKTIKALAQVAGVCLDTRANGPAIAAFLLAEGKRPSRVGSSNAWSIHHLYSGKFAYLGHTTTTHAAKSPLHFTQSAGLVAVHPVADALVDEYPSFAWFLRAHAYLRLRYDPDSAFSSRQDRLGFALGLRANER